MIFFSFDLDGHIHEDEFLPWRFERPFEPHCVDWGFEVIPILCIDRRVEIM